MNWYLGKCFIANVLQGFNTWVDFCVLTSCKMHFLFNIIEKMTNISEMIEKLPQKSLKKWFESMFFMQLFVVFFTHF